MQADIAAAGSTKVIVVDDHEAVRAGLERVLDRAHDLEPVAGLADDRDVVSLVAREEIDAVRAARLEASDQAETIAQVASSMKNPHWLPPKASTASSADPPRLSSR